MAYFTIKPYYGLISKTLMLQVRSAHPPMPHRNVFSKHPGVPLGLFGKPKRSSFSRVRGLHQAILWPLLQNARPPGSLRSPSDAAPECSFKTSRCSGRLIFRFRTDPPSVRRCSARLIRQAETLELQPLRGLHQAILWPLLQNARPPGLLRSSSDAAPECFFKTFRCSGRLIFRFRTDPPSVRRCSARLIRQAETLELQPLCGLRWAGGASLPPAPPSPAALRIRGGQLQRLPLRGAGAQRLKGGCATAMRSSAG